jgi:hypothetical protein
MVYVDGDNSLESYVVKDIETELAFQGSNADVAVIALADRAPGGDTSRGDWQGCKLYYVTQGMLADEASAVADWGECNMGDPQTLVQFVQWVKTNYTADHYMLALWDHGWTWRPGWTIADDTSADSLDQDELAAALTTVGTVDVIAYDTCQLAAIETMVTAKISASAYSASEEYVGWDGIEYELFIADLRNNPNMTAAQLATQVSLSAASTGREKTWSATDLGANFDALMTAVNAWAVALQNGLPTYKATYDTAFRSAQYFVGDGSLLDLYDVAAQIKAKVADSNIQAKSQAVMDAVTAATLHNYHTQKYSGAHGITIYVPQTAADLDYSADPPSIDWEYYQTLRFAQLSSWDEFLAAYIALW